MGNNRTASLVTAPCVKRIYVCSTVSPNEMCGASGAADRTCPELPVGERCGFFHAKKRIFMLSSDQGSERSPSAGRRRLAAK